LKLFNVKAQSILLFASIAALCISSVYIYMRFQQLKSIQMKNAMTGFSVAGNLIEIKNLIATENLDSKEKIATNLKTNITELTLSSLTNMGNVDNLDSSSFEGVCNLLAHSDLLFPKSNTKDVEGQINVMINLKLSGIEEEVRAESISRSRRLGDQHKCVAKNKKIN
jgi:hypothetical protein